MARILLVEDDGALRGALRELFEREGYEVAAAADAAAARSAMAAGADLVVLDVGLPDGDGVALCRAWRAAGVETPVLFLTARDDEIDVVRALDAGGGDYVTKPFRMQELLSRIRAQLRRGLGADGALTRGDISVDRARMTAKKDGEPLNLTLTEYKVLLMLMTGRGVTPRARLLEALWDDGAKYIDDNTLSVHVSRLRDKVGAAHIRTVRGVGYQWLD
ncbi:MAG: response regulator transcription factor [Clostridiales bacterium]|nr:response regulator transcription factor [Clostridiales bacterium]MDD6872133.1 response regulator transcription factor [Clostridiales bacterium]MDD7367138.1 response regulator transcription factor [Clostridiales bacterium]